MAGETPGAVQHSTDRYYRSGQVSVVHHSAADTQLKPGYVPAPATEPPIRADDRSTDKYYAARQQTQTVQQVAAAKTRAVLLPPVNRPAQLEVRTPGDINGVLGVVIERLRNGESDIQVLIADDVDLVRRMRTALELLVAREIITEAQARDVRLGKRQTPPPLHELPIEHAKLPPFDTDPSAFLDLPDVEDDEYDTSPDTDVKVIEDLGGEPAIFAPVTAQPASADDDDDFLAGADPA